ncbi:flagellar hook assembly protein FlgD [Bacillus velezensis]|uniref:flagellar hook assembly protein FlgD n=1 Tax=Bacillus amyloliquefaciens group TaxID=1938374 RepID=UPI0005B6328B|nr:MULTISPECIES: flagellar hook assembly protein FlgD [Bacillus amyloliquefaciens group]ATL39518.1 flagellar hook assembly protein FlgD [Bacillus velezensis]ATX83998.1 flagellar hook assembly protein FlgD [Bacillus velezensis]AWK46114.1 flagellar hook assembly protein FlgD [Bacillus velezensis]MBO3650327.1 flagellar hook assembly protein FlgD [Bacillus amyloliquefaciens]MCJ2174351.1 flagellar hook assembly protein FlgD [Bacillus amyloliquefaciens]
MTSVNSDYAAAGASTASSAKSTAAVNSSTNLGKDEFLKILMTQVQNQDPLNPVDDKEFISQMATFSSLEQMMNMNTTMTKFVENQDPFTMYVNWIGKNVTFSDSDGKDQTSPVNSVKHSNGNYVLVLENGKEVSPWNVTAVSETSK